MGKHYSKEIKGLDARASPLQHADAVWTPVLLIQGTEDFLPVRLVHEFRKAVAATETPIKMLVFKNEGHGLSLPSTKLVAAQEQIAWFRNYLSLNVECDRFLR